MYIVCDCFVLRVLYGAVDLTLLVMFDLTVLCWLNGGCLFGTVILLFGCFYVCFGVRWWVDDAVWVFGKVGLLWWCFCGLFVYWLGSVLSYCLFVVWLLMFCFDLNWCGNLFE